MPSRCEVVIALAMLAFILASAFILVKDYRGYSRSQQVSQSTEEANDIPVLQDSEYIEPSQLVFSTGMENYHTLSITEDGQLMLDDKPVEKMKDEEIKALLLQLIAIYEAHHQGLQIAHEALAVSIRCLEELKQCKAGVENE